MSEKCLVMSSQGVFPLHCRLRVVHFRDLNIHRIPAVWNKMKRQRKWRQLIGGKKVRKMKEIKKKEHFCVHHFRL